MNKLLYTNEGRYYLGRSETQIQYVFQFREDAPKDLRRDFLIDKEKDRGSQGSALEVAYELQEIIDSYWINTDQPRIKAVVEYLEKWEEKDTYDALILEKEKTANRILEIEKELSGYDADEMENWKPEAV